MQNDSKIAIDPREFKVASLNNPLGLRNKTRASFKMNQDFLISTASKTIDYC